MNTLFISDLHLEDSKPQTTALLNAFLSGPAIQADALYILGDLFEFWIGDDSLTETAKTVANGLRELKSAHVPCYFLHGNRDFLLGPEFAQRAGLELLPETCVLDLYGNPTLVLHGDTLCTDDVEYQNFRRQVRTREFRHSFLRMSAQERLQMAQSARDASKRHAGSTAVMNIMDVNESAVRKAFREHEVRSMIHGHTHRPAFHRHELGNGSTGRRMVLAEWNTSGSYLCVSPEHCNMISFDS
jgi:UDP-2,3-diacylglucosamine hydrolase